MEIIPITNPKQTKIVEEKEIQIKNKLSKEIKYQI